MGGAAAAWASCHGGGSGRALSRAGIPARGITHIPARPTPSLACPPNLPSPALPRPGAVTKATILSIDRLGMAVACDRTNDAGGQDAFKVRLPFPRPATDRKSIKELIVEMTKASAGAKAEAKA